MNQNLLGPSSSVVTSLPRDSDAQLKYETHYSVKQKLALFWHLRFENLMEAWALTCFIDFLRSKLRISALELRACSSLCGFLPSQNNLEKG